MLIETTSSHLSRVSAADSVVAGTSIANPADRYDAPSGDGIIKMGSGGVLTSNGLLLIPYGTDTAAQTFLMSVFAWDHEKSKAGNKDLWTAYLLASFTCTLCTLAGLAGTDVDASHLYCGTITLGVGNANVSNEIISPTGNVKASIILDAKAPRLIEVKFARNSSAVSMNCLYRKL